MVLAAAPGAARAQTLPAARGDGSETHNREANGAWVCMAGRQLPADVVNVPDLGVRQHPRAGEAKVCQALNGFLRGGIVSDSVNV